MNVEDAGWQLTVVDGMYWAFCFGYNEVTKEAKLFFWVTLQIDERELEPW